MSPRSFLPFLSVACAELFRKTRRKWVFMSSFSGSVDRPTLESASLRILARISSTSLSSTKCTSFTFFFSCSSQAIKTNGNTRYFAHFAINIARFATLFFSSYLGTFFNLSKMWTVKWDWITFSAQKGKGCRKEFICCVVCISSEFNVLRCARCALWRDGGDLYKWMCNGWRINLHSLKNMSTDESQASGALNSQFVRIAVVTLLEQLDIAARSFQADNFQLLLTAICRHSTFQQQQEAAEKMMTRIIFQLRKCLNFSFFSCTAAADLVSIATTTTSLMTVAIFRWQDQKGDVKSVNHFSSFHSWHSELLLSLLRSTSRLFFFHEIPKNQSYRGSSTQSEMKKQTIPVTKQ